MKLRRHLADAAGPVADLGSAAIDDLLERGDLEQWAPLAAAIRAEPNGEVAGTVLRLCAAHRMYGTSALWTAWIERLRNEGRGGLAGLRRARGLTQQAIADRMGIAQSDVSKLERRSDMRLSTLRSYVAATGGRLSVEAVFPDGSIQIGDGSGARPTARGARPTD